MFLEFYAVSMIFAVEQGLFNLVGHRILLFLGGLTYILYIGSYLSYNAVFVISSGAILGTISPQCLTCLRESYPSWAVFEFVNHLP
jgi:hypothetical protein